MATIVVGVARGERGEAAVHLGGMLSRSMDLPLVLAAVSPQPWPPAQYGGDTEYLRLQQEAAGERLAQARTILASDASVECVVEPARSVGDGLLQVCERHAARLVVLGSNTSGMPGRVSLGSVGQRILHSQDTPVCFAPEGFRVAADARLTRITVGFGRADQDSGLLATTVELTRRLGVPLRVICFAVRPSTGLLRGSIEPDVEQLVVGEWAQQFRAETWRAAMRAGADPESTEIVIVAGTSWEEAINTATWAPTDLLAIGAKTSAISRFLLGSHASKIVRHSPVPVLTVARASG